MTTDYLKLTDPATDNSFFDVTQQLGIFGEQVVTGFEKTVKVTKGLQTGELSYATQQEYDDYIASVEEPAPMDLEGRVTALEQDFANGGGGTAPVTDVALTDALPCKGLVETDVGKVLMMDITDNKLTLYQQAPAITGIAGVYELKVFSINGYIQLAFYDYQYQFQKDYNSLGFLDTETVAADLSASLGLYLGSAATVTVVSSTVTVAFNSAPNSGDGDEVWSGSGDVATTIITNSVLGTPKLSSAPFAGIVGEVDEGSNTVRLVNTPYITIKAGAAVVLPLNPSEPEAYSWGRTMFGGDNGTMIPLDFTSSNLSTFVQKSFLGALGLALNEAAIGGDVNVKIYSFPYFN